MKLTRTFLVAACLLASAAYAQTAPVVALPFVTHAAYFSKEVALPVILDPQVFVTMALHGLKAGGHYSVFENHFDQQPTGFTPLDGAGTRNSFVADSNGAAVVKLIAPEQMTHQNAVLVVYHSDGTPHGSERGAIGDTAHHQLIARVP
jgi:hypothetical protein